MLRLECLQGSMKVSIPFISAIIKPSEVLPRIRHIHSYQCEVFELHCYAPTLLHMFSAKIKLHTHRLDSCEYSSAWVSISFCGAVPILCVTRREFVSEWLTVEFIDRGFGLVQAENEGLVFVNEVLKDAFFEYRTDAIYIPWEEVDFCGWKFVKFWVCTSLDDLRANSWLSLELVRRKEAS